MWPFDGLTRFLEVNEWLSSSAMTSRLLILVPLPTDTFRNYDGKNIYIPVR